MTVRAWRITKTKHAATAFSGGGAKAYGGRWNSPGTAVVYAAGSTSLAILEMLVHLRAPELMQRYVTFELAFDEKLVTPVELAALPRNWRRSPSSPAVQQVGDDWAAEAGSAVLRIPSAVVPTEWNYLLNPAHPDYAKITIGPKRAIKFDPRLIKMSAP